MFITCFTLTATSGGHQQASGGVLFGCLTVLLGRISGVRLNVLFSWLGPDLEHHNTHNNTLVLESVAVNSWMSWRSSTLQRTGSKRGEKSPKCMENPEAVAVSMEQKECQQQIAAGFYCRGRHGLWIPHVSSLLLHASSFHPIKHKQSLQSETQGASWCVSWEAEGDVWGAEEGERRMAEDKVWMFLCCGFTTNTDPLSWQTISVCLPVRLPVYLHLPSLWRTELHCPVCFQRHEQAAL